MNRKGAFVLLLLVAIGPVSWGQGVDSTVQVHVQGQVQESGHGKYDSLISEFGIPVPEEVDTNLVLFLELWMGSPYRYGGCTRSGTDCSGFSGQLYENVYGIKIPRVSIDIYKASKKVRSIDRLSQGDLVFFHTGRSRSVNHVGVYLWDGYFAHASTKRGVIISRLDEGYYNSRFVSGGRFKS